MTTWQKCFVSFETWEVWVIKKKNTLIYGALLDSPSAEHNRWKQNRGAKNKWVTFIWELLYFVPRRQNYRNLWFLQTTDDNICSSHLRIMQTFVQHASHHFYVTVRDDISTTFGSMKPLDIFNKTSVPISSHVCGDKTGYLTVRT